MGDKHITSAKTVAYSLANHFEMITYKNTTEKPSSFLHSITRHHLLPTPYVSTLVTQKKTPSKTAILLAI